MSEIAAKIENFITGNGERIFWVLMGGWIQIYLASKKGVKFSKIAICGSLLISAYLGYWAGELAEIFKMDNMSNFIASLTAVGSNSLLNFYSENIEKFVKAILKGKFKIDIENEK